uniref:Uncharacterized protein n=1 Tax=Onchocerca volvulus TaxID=6282 RepID=A0A8R1U239_ONCVO
MVAHSWKLPEMKKILFMLLTISVCFIVINGTPITTTPTERRDNDGFNGTCKDPNFMMDFYPIRKRLLKYFATLNNSDLLSARASCESLYKLASEVLNRRIKPFIIINGTVNSAVDQQIISTERHIASVNWYSYYFGNFLTLRDRQSKIALLFDNCNNPTPQEHQPFTPICLQFVPYDNRFEINDLSANYGDLGNNHPRNAVIIPKMYDASADVIRHSDRLYSETKLIIVFRGNALSSSDIESITNTKIAPFADNRSVFVCYALHVGENSRSRIRRSSSFVMFSGKNVEASTFLIETTDEEKLREKLLKWKSKLDFLGSHHIIPFYFTKQSMEPTNSEEIFKETFGIQPTTLRLSASELAETGLIYWNSTTSATRNPGSVYAIVGFKKF